MKKYISLFLSILIIFSFTGCNSIKPVEENGKLSIVTTIFPYYDFARQIAGDKADITLLLSPGAESHDYEPSPQDIIKISNADLFIYNGGESDEWVKTILDSLDSRVKALCMFDYVTPLCAEEEHNHQHHHNEEHHHGEYDEHIWTDPINAIALSDEITEQLALIDKVNNKFYYNNLEQFTNALMDVDKELRRTISNAYTVGEIPKGEKPVIVVADRFPMRYFVESYKLEYESLFPGCSTETQPSISAVTDMIDYVNDNNVPVVFHIDTANDKFAKLISEDTGAESRTLYSCHNVTKEQFEQGVTYISLMKLNLTALMEAF